MGQIIKLGKPAAEGVRARKFRVETVLGGGASRKVTWVGESVSEWAVQSLRSPKVVLEDPVQGQRGRCF